MPQIKPLFLDPVSGRIREAREGDSIDSTPIGLVEADQIILFQDTPIGTCFQFIDEYASRINAIGPTSILRTKPWVDGITLETGIQGQVVKIAIIHGKKYSIPITLPINGVDLYLGMDGALTITPPLKTDGANWSVLVARYIDPNHFVFDPQAPDDLNDSFTPGGSQLDTLPSVTNQAGKFLTNDGFDKSWKFIRQSDIMPDFAINNFSALAPLIEIGQTINSPAFHAGYSLPPASIKLSDQMNSTEVDISLPGTSFNSSNSFTMNVQSTRTFTIKATSDDGIVLTKDCTITWVPEIFWGVGIKPSNPSLLGDFIQNLLGKALSSTKSKTFTVTPGAIDKIYYAYPDYYGSAIFNVGGFEGGFVLVAANIQLTNEYGITTIYNLYESDNANLGTTTVTVS